MKRILTAIFCSLFFILIIGCNAVDDTPNASSLPEESASVNDSIDSIDPSDVGIESSANAFSTEESSVPFTMQA